MNVFELLNGNHKSQESTQKVYLRFVNCTTRCVEIVWFSFSGERVRYKLLTTRGSYVDVNTYESHPWIVLDTNKHHLLLNGEFVLYPKSLLKLVSKTHRLYWPIIKEASRQIVNIKIPLYSLKSLCLLHLKDRVAGGDINGIGLPKTLERDLIALKASELK